VLGEYPGTSVTQSPTRSGEPSGAAKMPCSSSDLNTSRSWPTIVTLKGSATDLLPTSTMTCLLCLLITDAWIVSECSKSGTILPWKLSITTYEPAWISVIPGYAAVQCQVAMPPADRIGQAIPFASSRSAAPVNSFIACRCLECRRSSDGVSVQCPS
jgi:hypothetical protein